MDNKLDSFYEKLIKHWKTGGANGNEGGWAQFYYGIFEKVIKENNFKIVAEVGIGYGFHAKQILDNTNIDQLFLIDPMQFYPNDSFVTDVISYGGFEKLVKNINIHLQQHDSRYTWFRQPSVTINNSQIPDEYLDAVFIDADHSYNAVKADLNFWWKKIRKGGWLLGDDYNSCHPGTTQAVDEFALKNNLKLMFLYKPHNNYPIYALIK
jgi:hypothetical protein